MGLFDSFTDYLPSFLTLDAEAAPEKKEEEPPAEEEAEAKEEPAEEEPAAEEEEEEEEPVDPMPEIEEGQSLLSTLSVEMEY
jgi:ubiquinol-cytochrome c reductase subunit 6